MRFYRIAIFQLIKAVHKEVGEIVWMEVDKEVNSSWFNNKTKEVHQAATEEPHPEATTPNFQKAVP